MRRVVVMNGQSVVQVGQVGSWTIEQVERAGSLKPGIYDLGRAREPQAGVLYEGPILLAEREGIYQAASGGIIKHAAGIFSLFPPIGQIRFIEYDESGKVLVNEHLNPRRRKRGR